MEDEANPRVGTTVGSYRLLEVVGRGGMGIVYRAQHTYIGKEVAVKILHDRYAGSDEAVQRFLREARAASSINHPNIVDVTDFGETPDGTVFFVMEYLKGDPLDALLQREGRVDLLRTISILNQLTRAVGAAHALGIIHRDLKPENVILSKKAGRREVVRHIIDDGGDREVVEREGTFDFVKILDFGVAKFMEHEPSRTTNAGIVFGTPEYMAPETARIGVADPRSDIYAVGIMFYEMLSGVLPFMGEAAVDVMMKQVGEPVPPLREVAPGIELTDESERVIMKALEKDPDDRQQTMEELHEELQGCYGSVRYRRAQQRLPSAVGDALLPSPIPLTNPKHRPGLKQELSSLLGRPDFASTDSVKAAGFGAPKPEPAPAPAPEPAKPILLTRRKTRSKTLGLGVPTNNEAAARITSEQDAGGREVRPTEPMDVPPEFAQAEEERKK